MTKKEFVKYYHNEHTKVADGCKLSCGHVAFVEDHFVDAPTEYRVEFGGYCFGDLDRRSMAIADTEHDAIEIALALIKNCDQQAEQ